MDVYLSAHPHKTHELLHYLYTIRECATNQGGTFWKKYDQQFRTRQAVMPSSWSAINQDLWLRCMCFRGPESVQQHRQKQPCLDFNRSVCSFGPNCRYQHVCLNCGLRHPSSSCWSRVGTSPNAQPNANFNSHRQMVSGQIPTAFVASSVGPSQGQ